MPNEEKSFLTISAISGELLDKNENTYRRVELSPLSGMMFNPTVGKNMPVIDYDANHVSFNQYEESYLDGKEEKLYSAEIGTILPGKIIKKTVPEYSWIDKETGEEKSATVRSLAVFGDTTDKATFDANIVREFARNGYELATTEEVQLEDNIVVEEEAAEVPAES